MDIKKKTVGWIGILLGLDETYASIPWVSFASSQSALLYSSLLCLSILRVAT